MQLRPVARLGSFPQHRSTTTDGLHLVALLELPALPPDLNFEIYRKTPKKPTPPGARCEGLLFQFALGPLFLALFGEVDSAQKDRHGFSPK